MSALSSLGVDAKAEFENDTDIFSETFSRALFEVSDDDEFEKLANELGLSYQKIGVIGGDTFKLNGISKDVESLKKVYFNSFKELIESDL
jgi:phosphoribosylformylglycinamidine synthase